MPRRTAITIAPSSDLTRLVQRANTYADDARAHSTRRGYLRDYDAFAAWCSAHGLEAMPATPSAVAVYLSALADAGRRVSTIERALTGIAHAHRTRGIPWPKGHPTLLEVMAGIRRKLGVVPEQKAPLSDDELAELLGTLDDGLTGARDRALLLLGWWGAFRRSELVALTTRDITRVREGLVITVRRSKTDQEGRGAHKAVPFADDPSFCAVRALDAWLRLARITKGPLFRAIDRHGHVSPRALSDRSVALIVQRTAARAGLDTHRLAGHSLRAGFVTTAAKKGRTLDAIMRQTHHKSERVARSYVRLALAFDGNAAVGLR